MRQLAVITPYAEFTLQYLDEDLPKTNLNVKFARRSQKLPKPPEQKKVHPASIVLTKLEELSRVQQAKNKDANLDSFLKDSFEYMTRGR
jgi:DNA topoisomerase VI subunit B